jgi:DNA gyrase subunit A
MGVVFARFAESDKIIAVAKNTERNLESQNAVDDQAADAQSEDAGKEETANEQ